MEARPKGAEDSDDESLGGGLGERMSGEDNQAGDGRGGDFGVEEADNENSRSDEEDRVGGVERGVDKGQLFVNVSYLSGSDKWIWAKDGNGRLWNSKIMERHKVIWWCILSNALPLRAIIKKRFHIEEVNYPLCGGEEESAEHLFLSCNFAFHFWRLSPGGFILLLVCSCITMVARNHLGEVVWVHSARLDYADALCGEAATCCLALDIAKLNGHKFVIMGSDSRIVINSLNCVLSY
uniref:Reverse transcriptase zinc-binding domain-containing protein n=1 Tax=Cannabis sativa TaxID=3483 RepID=A0A803NLP7_CANSA